jgi:hypothetical protein
MKNELELLRSMQADFLSLFYSIRLNSGSITLQGKLTVESLQRCKELSRLELSEQDYLIGNASIDGIKIEICLTV